MSGILPDTLPEGWVLTSLGEAFQINPPRPDLTSLKDSDDVTFVPMGAVDDLTGTINAPKIRQLHQVLTGFTVFREGDVIMAKITPCMENGKAAVASGLLHGIGFGSTEFHVLRPMDPITANYLLYFIRQPAFRKAAETKMTGTGGLKRVPAQYLKEHPFPFPPLAEQKRIITNLDAAMQEAKATHAKAEEGCASIERMREKALSDAHTGKRTEAFANECWTESDERQKLVWMEELLLASTVQPRESRIISDLFKMLPVTGLGSVLSSAPKRFLRCRIGMAVRVTNGSTPSRKVSDFWDGDIPWVSSGEVRNTILSSTRETITQKALSKSSCKLLPRGTVLMAMIGEGKTRGQAALLDIEASVNQNIAALEPNPDVILPRYLWYWLQFRYEATRLQGGGSGPRALNCQAVRELPLLLPSLDEQQEIVDQIERSLSESAILEEQLKQTAAVADEMVQSALEQAFRGELVPREASLARAEGREFEDAAALLARIRAEADEKKNAPRPEKIPRAKPMKLTPDSLKEAINAMPEGNFTFMDLRGRIPGDYDELQKALFKLLEEKSPVIQQVFDKTRKRMEIQRVPS